MTLDIPVGLRFYKDAIGVAADREFLPRVLVAAIVWQESGFNTDAFRHEPDFWNRYLKLNPLYRNLNPRRVSSSYGLMQVMYCRVHEDKLTSNDALPPEHLFVPEAGLATGCALLAELYRWACLKTPEVELAWRAAIASYNGGRGGNDPSKDAPLRNDKYAREVLAKLAILKSVNAF